MDPTDSLSEDGVVASSSDTSGNTLIDAIMDKYGDMESGFHDMGDVKVYFSAPAKKTEQEQSTTLKLPRCLVLNRRKIRAAGNAGKVSEVCDSVRELDLAENLLDDWNEVLTIASSIPKLEFLNLSTNPLQKATMLSPQDCPFTMATIQRLVLNNTKLPWDTVHNILNLMTSLEELHLSLNDYTSVQASTQTYPNLKLLQFNNNQICDWQDIHKFGVLFPKLESLILMKNPIKEVDGATVDVFPKLTMLCLSETLLDSWEMLDRLNEFPSLTQVLLHGIPLLAKGNKKRLRQFVIARLEKIVQLNRSHISETEREEAERTFIRQFKDSDNKPTRFQALLEKHGNVQDLAQVSLRPREKFCCKLLYDGQTQDIEVRVKQTVAQFKKQVGAIIGIPPSQYRIFHSPVELSVVTAHDELKWPKRMLHCYNLQDGDKFEAICKT